ncbi:MAG: adenosine deaminase [Terriglobia bacterium]
MPENLPCPPAPHFVHTLPKAELHIHLEGSVDPETLRELARTKGRLQEQTEDWIRRQEKRGFRYGSLPAFLEAFKGIAVLLETPADYALAATRLFERLASQNVRYAEITLSAGVILWKKQSLPEIFEALAGATADFTSRSPLRVQWIFDAIRHFGADHAREVLGWARIFRDDGVVAFGIGGDEDRGPAGLFSTIFTKARSLGLHTTAHAGESSGPESVRQAVETLRAERIGHGLAGARDSRVLDTLRERRVALEVCLSSNVATGAIKRVEDHPLRRFIDAGIEVTLNTDDPALFRTSLENEIALAIQAFELNREEITGLLKNAIRSSFMPDDRKQALLKEFEACAASCA